MTMSEQTVIEQALHRLTDPRLWYGLSGHQVTGEDVARHLEAAGRLMERENWDPQLYEPFRGHHLRDALDQVRRDGAGDADTQYVARKIMELLLRLHTSAPYVDYEVWSEHRSRTLPEVLDLLRVTAEVARRYGRAALPA
ncbi:hypothetical protein AB0L49_23845 [Streptomyces antimycoticus]|uniref:DUF6197 family protein n=1 Tax=Streptomyces antimycoticus TaxID=68175 RepID=UPI0034432875